MGPRRVAWRRLPPSEPLNSEGLGVAMSAFNSHVATWFANHYGTATSFELARLGMSRHQRERLVSEKILLVVHRGVYRLASSPLTFEARCRAVCAACPEAVIGAESAARWWAFRGVRWTDEPLVLTPPGSHPIASGVTIRRSNLLDPRDVVEIKPGIRVTSPPRTVFDLARDLPDRVIEALLEQVLDRHCAMPTIWDLHRRMSRRGRDGAARFGRVLSQREVWQKPAQSNLELRVLQALSRDHGLGLVRQHPLRLPDGCVIHLDGADPTIRWGLEVDHVTWHGGRHDAQRDKGRDRGARRVGWQVERVTDQELGERFHAVITELAALHRQRSREVVPRPSGHNLTSSV